MDQITVCKIFPFIWKKRETNKKLIKLKLNDEHLEFEEGGREGKGSEVRHTHSQSLSTDVLQMEFKWSLMSAAAAAAVCFLSVKG